MTPDMFSRLVTGKQRPFALYMFLTANHLIDNPNMRLGPMRKDFGYMAKALKDRIASGEFKSPGTIFFAEAEFQDSQEVFPMTFRDSLPAVSSSIIGFESFSK